MSARTLITGLGYAGLIPFVIPALLVLAGSAFSGFAITTAETYALAIICFLTGSWWGMATGPGKQAGILLSNVYLVIAFLLMLLAPAWWALAAAILLLGIFALERSQSLFAVLSDYYRHMRAVLTVIASASMLVIHFAR